MNLELKVEKVENSSMCGGVCNGYCCRSVPCSYFPADFGETPTVESIAEKIRAGLATLLRVEGCSNRIMTAKILNRPEVDIVDWDEFDANEGRMSWLRECALLGDRGCTLGLDERPSGGAHYVPQFVHGTRQCYTGPRDSIPRCYHK